MTTLPDFPLLGFGIEFALGQKPDSIAVSDLLKQAEGHGRSITITHLSREGGWMELLCSGLAFELSGFGERDGVSTDTAPQWIGQKGDLSDSLCLTPGAHLSGGGAQWPVFREMAVVALALLDLPGAQGVIYGMGRWRMSAQDFRRIIPDWLKGESSAFPLIDLP